MGEMSKLELGVFLPIGNNGFLMSKTAPQYQPSFEMNKQIAILAESFGFDFVFSMSKWRGFGGATRFWDSTLESLSLMTGLAAKGFPLWAVRTVLELAALAAGWVLGGNVGIGTVAFAFSIGPLGHFFLAHLHLESVPADLGPGAVGE